MSKKDKKPPGPFIREDFDLALAMPSLKQFTIDDLKFRVYTLFDADLLQEFKAAVIKKYGTFYPDETKKAVLEAIKMWIAHVNK
ncbi:MAG: hypothetical protein HWN66_08975 [Candidatus Helarchaeota archaeon]|nr:hypothetical protein [Candidatus Helarchaeota archaeon]